MTNKRKQIYYFENGLKTRIGVKQIP